VSEAKMDFKYQVIVTVSIFVGLFFLEYPPIFLLGYWSWSAAAHKTLTGILLILNLVLSQYAARRLGFFREAPRQGRGGARGTSGTPGAPPA
jgi:hypothetical protein